MLLSTVNDTSLAMLERPEGAGGTDAAVRATFRVVPPGSRAELRQRAGAGCRTRGGAAAAAAAGFEQAASFAQAEPLRRYHAISFFASGVRRSFLLEPLFTLRDEFYTIYFNLAA